MSKDQGDVVRKLRSLQHAEATRQVAKTCRYFGVGRSSFYRWRTAYRTHGEAGLVNRPRSRSGTPIRHRSRSKRRCSIFAASTTSAPCGSSGIWRATTASSSRTQPSHAYSSAMASTGFLVEPACARCTPSATTSRCQVTTSGWTSSSLRSKGNRARRSAASSSPPSMMQPGFGHSRSTRNIPRPAPSTSLTTSSTRSRSISRKSEPTLATRSRPSSTGMSRTKVSATATSSAERRR